MRNYYNVLRRKNANETGQDQREMTTTVGMLLDWEYSYKLRSVITNELTGLQGDRYANEQAWTGMNRHVNYDKSVLQ